MGGLIAKNIISKLNTGGMSNKSRNNEISGFINTTVVDVYTDEWMLDIYEDKKADETILDRIIRVNERYCDAGYAGLPYHYIVVPFDGIKSNEPGYYIAKSTSVASGIDDSNISICVYGVAGLSLDINSGQGTEKVIKNLKELLKTIFNTLRISPQNINLSTKTQNGTGQKSFNGISEFKKELLDEIAKEYGLDSGTDYIVVAGPSTKSKRTLSNLSKEIYGTINNDFIDEVILSSNLEGYDSTTPIPLGTYLCLPSGTNYIAVNNSNTETDRITSTGASNLSSLAYVTESLNLYKENLSYVNPNQISYLTDRSKVSLSTNYGGKESPEWLYRRMEFPGYHNAFLYFERLDSSEDPVYIQFLIGPSDFSESRSNLFNSTKTMGGWIAQRSGKNAINIQFSGYMLDIKSQMERHSFLENYKKYVEDEKVEDQTYINHYRQKFVIEGREYYGHLVSVDFAKSADKQFLYRYNMSFVAYNDKKIYDANWAVLDMSLLDAGVVSSAYLPKTVAEVANTLDGIIKKGTAAYDYLTNLIKSAGNNSAALAKIKNTLAKYSSNHWAKKYLDALINADVITNIEDWGNYDSPAPISHCVALAYKALVGGSVTSSGGKWSLAYMQKLDAASCVSKHVYNTYSVSNENDNMPRGWLLDIMCLSLVKKNSSVRKLYDEAQGYLKKQSGTLKNGFYASESEYAKVSSPDLPPVSYQVYLDVLCKSGYVNTPSEWSNFSGSITNGDALAIIAKVGGYRVKD